MACLATLLAGCEALSNRLLKPRMKAVCQVLEGYCTFENYGDPGASCVRIILFRADRGETLRSKKICSGEIETNGKRFIPIQWPKGDRHLEFCMGNDLQGDFKKNCSVRIERE